jgi:hypothetical protein
LGVTATAGQRQGDDDPAGDGSGCTRSESSVQPPASRGKIANREIIARTGIGSTVVL